MARTMTLQEYVNWALNYPIPPQPEPPAGYAYDDPFRHGQLQSSPSPLPLDHLHTCKLVPATMAARVQLALEYHQRVDGGKAIVWNHPDEMGELVNWYEGIGLWGSTAFSARAGKMGTVLARTREALLERALRYGGGPRPNALPSVLHLPGMEKISPVLLLCGEDHDPIHAMVRQSDLQMASDREPLFQQEHMPSEWLVTLLCEERSLAIYHASDAMPTVFQVLQVLFLRMRRFEACPGPGEWVQEAEDMPYAVCESQMRALKVLLGTTSQDFQCAFGHTLTPSPG